MKDLWIRKHHNINHPMKLTYPLFVIAILALVAGFASDGFAQKAEVGRVTGTVLDASTGDPLIGATVQIEGTTIGAKCDLDGKFTLKDVPVGAHTLIVSMVGYAQTKVTSVEITSGGVESLDITMKSEALEIKGQVVTAKALKNTEASLLKERQGAASVSDAISAQEIAKSGSGNAGDAMTRVTGASVVGGKYVYVRGLGDRYSNTNLNGSPLPSPDPDVQTIPMDLIPAALLDNIVVQKTFTPDKWGDFSGGSVDFATKDFPEFRTITFSSSVGYNSQSTSSDILWYDGGSKDWLGYDDGKRDIPAYVLANANMTDGIRIVSSFITGYPDSSYQHSDVTAGELATYLDSASRAFNTNFTPRKKTAPMDQSYSISYGDQFNLFTRPLGVQASFTYNHKYRYYEDGTKGWYRLLSPTNGALDTDYRLDDKRGTDEVLWGGLLNLKYMVHNNHKFGFNYIRNQSGESSARSLIGPAYDINNDTANVDYRSRALEYKERRLSSAQFTGEHYGLLGSSIRASWMVGIASTKQDEPDLRYSSDEQQAVEQIDPETNETLITYNYLLNRSKYPTPQHLWRTIEEKNNDYKLDFEVPLATALKFKTGAAYLDKKRTQRQELYNFAITTGYGSYNGDVDAWASNVGLDTVRVLNTTTGRTQWVFSNMLTINDQRTNNYDGETKIFGTYGMFEVGLSSRLSLVTGVRYETTRMETTNLGASVGIADSSSQIEGNDWLPSVNLIYRLRPNMNARLAYGRTVARPNLKEMSHAFYYEFAGGITFQGNPDITYTHIDSYDARWEWFMRPGEILAVSGFYKRFKDPLELVMVNINHVQSIENVDRATVYGLELEFRRSLDHAARVLRYFKLGGNLTLVKSKVKIPEGELADIRLVDPNASDTRSMVGQSPYIVNLDLGYDNPIKGTSLTLLYNVFGKRMAVNAQDFTPDIYEQPAHTVDLIGSQRVLWGVNLKFSAKNILNAEKKFTQEFNGVEYITQEYKPGRTYSFGISYTFE